MQNAPLEVFCNTFDLHQAIIGLEKQFLVFLRVAVFDRITVYTDFNYHYHILGEYYHSELFVSGNFGKHFADWILFKCKQSPCYIKSAILISKTNPLYCTDNKDKILCVQEFSEQRFFCVYFVMCGLIAQWPSEFNTSINRLIGDIFFVTKCIVKWAVIWWNLSSF